MLEVKHISSGYGKKQVLFDVSFEVSDNEVVLLTGGNGSGKSTVLKCIYGLLPLWNKEGKIIFNGKDITNIGTSNMVKEGIVYIPQKNNYFESLSVHENLMVSGSIYSNDVIRERESEVYQFSNLYNLRDRTPFNLSGGERQLLALSNALMHRPKFLLFDEPFSGLDKTNTNRIMEELMKCKKQNISILLVEHKSTFSNFSNRKLILHLGRTH